MKNIREMKKIAFVALLAPEDRTKINGSDIVPPELKPMADVLGVEKVTDLIAFETSVGTIIFDVYDSLTEKPKAPLALERENSKRQKLADTLDQDEFELTAELKEKLEKALADDTIWQQVKMSVQYKVKDETRYSQFSSAALDIFTDCRKALLDIFAAG
jgi:hypothetical protein